MAPVTSTLSFLIINVERSYNGQVHEQVAKIGHGNGDFTGIRAVILLCYTEKGGDSIVRCF